MRKERGRDRRGLDSCKALSAYVNPILTSPFQASAHNVTSTGGTFKLLLKIHVFFYILVPEQSAKNSAGHVTLDSLGIWEPGHDFYSRC